MTMITDGKSGTAVNPNREKIDRQEKKAAGWAQVMFKKLDLIAFLEHDAEQLDSKMAAAVQELGAPAAIVKRFSATGEDGLVDRFLKAASGGIINRGVLNKREIRYLARKIFQKF